MTESTAIAYLGCPVSERSDAERMLSAAGLDVLWADTLADVLAAASLPVACSHRLVTPGGGATTLRRIAG